TLRYAERLVKFLLWARGGWRIYISGPKEIGRQIALNYSQTGERSFDVQLMSRVYERPFEVITTRPELVPPETETTAARGGHLEGCRLGFNLGDNAYKV